jgi:uncharacterized membrane protein YiaA
MPSANASLRPTAAFVGASWAALLVGVIGYLTGLYNADLARSEKGFYLAVLLFGLFAAVSLQKAVRDQAEGVRVTAIYFALSWVAVASSVVMLSVGLWNATMRDSEKGFYAMAFTLGLFAAVAVQKNVRDLAATEPEPDAEAGTGETHVEYGHPGPGAGSVPGSAPGSGPEQGGGFDWSRTP